MGRLMALKMAHLGGHLIIYDTDSDASGAPDEEIRQPTGHYACERRQPFPAAIEPAAYQLQGKWSGHGLPYDPRGTWI